MNRWFKVISWNVRGLNQKEKRIAIRKTFLLEKPVIICLQETKWARVSKNLVHQTCGSNFKDFLTIDAQVSRGGVLLAWNSRILDLSNTFASENCLTAIFVWKGDGSMLAVTNVYAPSNSTERNMFYSQLSNLSCVAHLPWIMCGDFNLIRAPEERSSGNFNSSAANAFDHCISNMNLIDLPLTNKAFTWSNNRDNPTLARLDRFFVSQTLANWAPNIQQYALPNTSFDHLPIACNFQTHFPKSNTFRLENYFLKLPDFKDLVLNSWLLGPVAHTLSNFITNWAFSLQILEIGPRIGISNCRIQSFSSGNSLNTAMKLHKLELSQHLKNWSWQK